MEPRTNIKAPLHLRLSWLVAYSTFLSTCLAQRIDTIIFPPNQPSAHDAPAYISSVGHRVAILGDFVYLADGYAGLGVYKLGGPESARLIGEYQTGEYTHTVRVDGDRAYTLDSLNGTVVFDARDPARLRRVALSDVSPEDMVRAISDDVGSDSGGVKGVAAIVENRVYIAREDLGVAVIEMRSPRDMPPPPFRNRVNTRRAVMPGSALSAGPQVVRVNVGPVPADTAVQGVGAGVSPDDTPASSVDHLGDISTSVARLELAAGIQARTLRLWISGPPGQTVHVQRSSALVGDWEDWQTITLGEAPIELIDEDAAGADQIFYRAVTQ